MYTENVIAAGSFRASSHSIASNLDKIFDGSGKDKTVSFALPFL